jgi:SAM-dependent methyltransferase
MRNAGRIAAPIEAFARWRRRRDWQTKWSDTAPKPFWLVDDARPQVKDALADGWIPPNSSVVELGCGIGHGAAYLASQGCQVLALDVSSKALERARSLHGEVAGLEFREADVTATLRSTREHDVLVDMACYHALPPRLVAPYGENVRRLTRPGSHLLYLMSVMRDGRTLDAKLAALTAALGPGFEVVRFVSKTPTLDVDAPRPSAEIRILRT